MRILESFCSKQRHGNRQDTHILKTYEQNSDYREGSGTESTSNIGFADTAEFLATTLCLLDRHTHLGGLGSARRLSRLLISNPTGTWPVHSVREVQPDKRQNGKAVMRLGFQKRRKDE
jgi:hypothetical protein